MKLSYKDAVKTIHQEQQALFHHMEEAKRSGYICPYCGNGSGSDGTGNRLVRGKGNLFHCFVCGKSYDIIEYCEKSEGLKHIEAVKMLLAELGHELDSGQPDVLPEQHTEATEAPEEPETDYTGNYAEWSRRASEGTETALYMESRGISREVWERYGIGYNEATQAVILPCSKTGYIERFVHSEAAGTRYKAHGRGAKVWNYKAIEDPQSRVVCIVEGVMDALTIEECGLPAVSSNSVANAEYLGRLIISSPSAKQKCFCILTDTDEAGMQAAVTLQRLFSAAGIVWRNEQLAVIVSEKDVNAAYLKDPDGTKQRIKGASERCLAALEAKQKEGEEDMNQRQEEVLHGLETAPEGQEASAGAIDPEPTLPDAQPPVLQIREAKEPRPLPDIQIKKPVSEYLKSGDFKKDIEDFRQQAIIPTGFRSYDTITGGGLFAGLYVLAANSGAGKTTFSLQLADQIAERGRHVLFFSLEQSRFEITSKSLARTLYRYDRNSRLSSLQIRKGQEPEKVEEALRQYSKEVGDRLTIVECGFNTDPAYIRNYTETYMKIFEQRPVLIIDYLQVLQPDKDERGRKNPDRRQAVDEIITKLKQLSRDTGAAVIVISSLNRENYYESVSMKALKESGGIEYSADAVLALQFTAIDNANSKDDAKKTMNEEIMKSPRDMVLTVLKNRYGKLFKIYFSYYPEHDYFAEEGTTQPKREQIQKKEPALH